MDQRWSSTMDIIQHGPGDVTRLWVKELTLFLLPMGRRGLPLSADVIHAPVTGSKTFGIMIRCHWRDHARFNPLDFHFTLINTHTLYTLFAILYRWNYSFPTSRYSISLELFDSFPIFYYSISLELFDSSPNLLKILGWQLSNCGFQVKLTTT